MEGCVDPGGGGGTQSKVGYHLRNRVFSSGHHGDSWTNKPMNHDGRGSGLISPLHNADKTSTGSPIG